MTEIGGGLKRASWFPRNLSSGGTIRQEGKGSLITPRGRFYLAWMLESKAATGKSKGGRFAKRVYYSEGAED